MSSTAFDDQFLPHPDDVAQAQPKRRPYNASGSLSEYGVFPECDAAPVAAQAPQDKQGDAGRLLRLMRYIGSAQVKRLRAQLGDVPTLGEIRRAVDSLPEGGPPVFNDQLTAQTPAVPEGWRLVPDTPTPEWVEAAALGVRIGTIAHTIADVLAAAPTPPASAAPAPADLDAAFEAVRKRLCKLPKYSFLLDGNGGVRRVTDTCGNWIEFDAAHALFDPVAVDAAIQAGGSHD